MKVLLTSEDVDLANPFTCCLSLKLAKRLGKILD